MKYLSTFSGIEAATVAWHPLGWEPVGFSEIDPFPCAVLKHHYPNTPNYGDITKFRDWSVEPFQLLVGGSPCQSFSVAGLRKGLADERGNLMLEFGRLAQHYRPTWVVWENVPGVLSSNGGRDFGTFLGMLAEFGYGFAYRVLDAQYFGVAQRRRRVFVVAHLGDWRPAAAVLFDPHCMSGHPAPSREKGKGIAGGFADGIGNESDAIAFDERNIQLWSNQNMETSPAMTATDYKGAKGVAHAFKLRGGCDGGGKGYLGQDECAFTLSTHQDQHLAQPIAMINMQGSKSNAVAQKDGPSYTLNAMHGHDVHVIAQPIPLNTMTMQGRPSDDANPRMGSGIGQPGDPAPTITKGHSHAVAQPITYDLEQVTAPHNKQSRTPGDPCHTLGKGNTGRTAVVRPMAFAFDSLSSNSMKSANPVSGCNQVEISKTLDTTDPNPSKNQGSMAVVQPMAFDWQSGGDSRGLDPKHTAQLQRCQVPAVMTQYAVRRLTPVEAERLQGFPDNYTAIPWRGKDASQCPDGPRYKALGNSMAVPVMRWIGERIQAVEELMKEIKQ